MISRLDCTSRSPTGTFIGSRSWALDSFSRLIIALGAARSPLCNQVGMTLGVAFSRWRHFDEFAGVTVFVFGYNRVFNQLPDVGHAPYAGARP
jgi:hypothetical protein